MSEARRWTAESANVGQAVRWPRSWWRVPPGSPNSQPLTPRPSYGPEWPEGYFAAGLPWVRTEGDEGVLRDDAPVRLEGDEGVVVT